MPAVWAEAAPPSAALFQVVPPSGSRINWNSVLPQPAQACVLSPRDPAHSDFWVSLIHPFWSASSTSFLLLFYLSQCLWNHLLVFKSLSLKYLEWFLFPQLDSVSTTFSSHKFLFWKISNTHKCSFHNFATFASSFPLSLPLSLSPLSLSLHILCFMEPFENEP